MRAHTYQLNRVGADGESLYSKHFLLGNNQLEFDLSPRSLFNLKAVVFWDCFYSLDNGTALSRRLVNDVGVGFDVGFLAKKVASLYLGYNVERRSFSIFLGPSLAWD